VQFGRHFAFLERVVLARVSTMVEHDEWANGQEDSDRLIVRSKTAGLSDSHSPHGIRGIRVVQHTFDVSSPDALRASLAKVEAIGVVDIDSMLLIRQQCIKLTYQDVEVKKKGVIGTLLTQAIYLAEPDMVEAILEHGANPNLSNAGDGQSPLYIAVRAHVHVHTHTHNGARVLNERARSCWWPSSRDTDEVFQALGPRDPEHPPY
jgi:hypothetical protein